MHPLGHAFYARHIKPLLRLAWSACVEADEAVCSATLKSVPKRYRLDEGTGFTKVTVSSNNPTPLHTDYGNMGLTFLMTHSRRERGGGEARWWESHDV
eukprot:6182098-Pleurochrysis_carterae.AAC.3